MPTPTELVDALEQTYRSLIEVARSFDDDDWDRPTDCPGWSVKDHLSHLVGMERVLGGEPDSTHVVPEGLAHVRSPVAAYMEAPVDERRGRAGKEVLAELEEVVERRIAQLRALDDAGFEADAPGFMGSRGPTARLLPVSVFDRWVHELDVRRATGRPGNLEGPAAAVAVERSSRGLAAVVPRNVEAPDGTVVRVEVTGPYARTLDIRWGDIQQGDIEQGDIEQGDIRTPAVTLTCDHEVLVRLAAGRGDPATLGIVVDGDADLARRVLEHAAVTP